MERSLATEILTTIQESRSLIVNAITDLEGTCPEETCSSCARLVEAAMINMFDYVTVHIYQDYRDLAPDWYDGGFPTNAGFPHLKLRKEARDTLLAAFDAAYEKVQFAGDRLSQIPDPVERAMFQYGILETSARLCRGRVALLAAELES